MSNGNRNLPQTTDELRQSVLDGVRGIYSRRYEEAQPQLEQEERPSLSSYSQDIQDLLSGTAVRDEYRNTQRQAMEKLLAENDIDVKSFFEEKPNATVVDVMRRTNFEGFADKERAYSTGHSTDYGRNRALSQIQEQFSNRFDNSLVFPDLGVKIDEYIPASIREDDRRRADFEKAFYQETGIALDFDGSNRVGDLYVEGSGIGNALRGAGSLISDLGVGIMDATLGTAEFFYDILGGDIGEADKEFLEKQAAGEISTQLEAAEGSMSKGAMDLFWASFTSAEARRQLVESQKSRRRIDFQAMQDRNEFDTNVVVGNSIDMLIESAPLLLDLTLGSHGGSFLMKGATKAVAKKAATKVGVRTIGTRGGGKALQYFDPKMPGRTLTKEAAQKVITNSNTVQRILNQGGALVVSDLLVASQMHSDNVGQEWYDNLSGFERASYLAQQSTAEVLSGMVLNNVLGRGFFGKTPKSKVTQEGWKARKKFVTEYGKNIVNSTFLGISEEALAEAGTAAWQYVSEIDARIAGGDVGARFDINELDRRVKDAAAAGLMMGGLAGFAGGIVGGAARAYMASFHHSNIEGKKTIEKLAQAVTEAPNATDRQKALDRLQAEVKKRSGAQSALSRAYFRMSESNPEIFEKVARLQGQINTLVHQHKTTSDPELQGALFQEIKTLIEEKQKLENEAFEGDTTFEDIYKEEAEAVAKERGGKLKGWKDKYDSDPERLAEQAVQQGIQNQIESLEAAQAVNSPEQNADDDVQDREGQTQGEAQAEREAAQDNSVEGNADNQFAPNIDDDADIDDRVKSKYRDVIGTVNNLMKGFKNFGIKVVMHKTSDSYFKATGKKGRGVFTRNKSTKTIHMDLEKMALGAESDLEGVYNTPVHEFLHLAFTTADVATLRQYKKELLALARSVGKEKAAQDIFNAVENKYKGASDADMLNEQITNALERLINMLPEASKPGFLQRCLRAFLRVFGLEKAIMGELITPTDFLNFIKEFKQARDEGIEFKREEIPIEDEVETESRDIGMSQPSKAYPDLINKTVYFSYSWENRFGYLDTSLANKTFKDYWHFRNWWIKETGNGKRAQNMLNFYYIGNDGTRKNINPPKPKVDKETGEIIDMEPALLTPAQRRTRAIEREDTIKGRLIQRRELVPRFGDALKMMVGKIIPTGFKVGQEMNFDSRMFRQEVRSELPVVYSERFYTNGLNISDLDQLGRDFGDSLQFLLPVDVNAELAFTARNNGDGTVTIDVHSNAFIGNQIGDGQPIADGTVSLESSEINKVEEEAKEKASTIRSTLDSLSRSWKVAKDLMPLILLNGQRVLFLPFDRTFDKSGVRNVMGEPGKITAHVDEDEATQVEVTMIDIAKEIIAKEELKPGDIGYFFVAFTLLGAESSFGNPFVFEDIILNQATDEEILNALKKNLKEGIPKRSNAVLYSAIKGLMTIGARNLRKTLVDVKIYGDRLDDLSSEEISLVRKAIVADHKKSTFDTRKARVEDVIKTADRKSEVLEKYNDPIYSAKNLNPQGGEVLAASKIPFIVNEKGRPEGFVTVHREKEPFSGVIEYDPEAFKDKEHEPPTAKLLDGIAHISDLLPDSFVKITEEVAGKLIEEAMASGVKVEEKKKKGGGSEKTYKAKVSVLRSKLDPQEAQDIIREQFGFRERNREPGLVSVESETRNVDSLESLDIGLSKDPSTDLPFEPNNLNAFQAFMARVDQLFANKYANVFSLQRAIEGAKRAVVDISQDFINAETLMYGKTANDLEKLDEKVKAISEEMKANGLTSDQVSQYLIARHAAERNALIAERTDGKMVDGSGMSNERAQEVMDSFSPKEKAALDSVAKKVDAITKDTRQTMVKYGLESQETIDAFEAMFENYVPLGGLSADEMSADTSMYPTGGAGMSIYGDTTRRARGRKSEANNVLAQAIAQNAAVHAKARKNEALSSLYNLVEANPNTKVWKITKEVPFDAQSAVGVRINGEQRFIVFTNSDHAKALKNMGVEKLDLFSKVMRSFSGFLRRSFTTANPEFIISNFARDIQSALFNAMAEADIPGGQIQSKYIATKIIERVKQTLPALLKGAVGKDLDPEMAAYFEEFKEDGGQTGWGFVKDVGTIAAEIEAEVNEKSRAKKAMEWMQKNSINVVENVNDAFENSIRLAAYMEARKAGTSREKAAELAKNITVNFNRSGELGAVANAWYMFFNASVQGTVRLARSLGTLKDVRKPNGELESWHNRLNAAQKMAFGLSLTTGMLTAINLAMSDEDEDGVLFYNKIPDYEKERNLIIMYDGKNYLKIPLPYGFNVFANMGSAMAEVAGGQRDMTDAGMFILNSAFSSFSPVSFGQSKDAAKYLAKGLTPTIFKPMVDIAVNESYFGSSVYKEQFPVGAPKPEAEMSFRSPEGVRNFFQWMNEATGGSEFVPGKADFNPDKFWYGFEYYIGGAGQFVTRTIGTGRDTYEMIKEGEKVPMKANDFPFLRKIYGEFSKYYDSDVYVENSNKVSQLYKERQEAENKNDKRYKGIMVLESERKQTEKQIKRLRELRKEARDIKNYVERQNRIYELYEKERSLVMQFNKQYDKLRGED